MKRLSRLLATSSVLALGSAAALGAPGAGAVGSSGLPTLTLALSGKTIMVGGSTVSGAVNVQMTVTGERMGSVQLFRLANGVPPSVFPQAVAAVGAHHGDVNYLRPYGSIGFGVTAPKGTSSAQTELSPGTYFALDTSGHGPPPHALFTVTQSASPASLPTPGATISTIDFGFKGPKTLHDGEVVRFANAGFVVHMDDWIGAKNMATAQKLVKALRANSKAAFKLAAGFGEFASPMSSGGLLQQVVTEKPGIYVQACFMDTQDGRQHTQLGMERIIKIVK